MCVRGAPRTQPRGRRDRATAPLLHWVWPDARPCLPGRSPQRGRDRRFGISPPTSSSGSLLLFLLENGPPAVDVNDLACDETRVGGAQEQHRTDHLVQRSEAAGGDQVDQRLALV